MGDISYEPIIKDMTWSYSRVKAFDMCPYGWYLKYIQKIRGKDMFFSSYGSFVHKLLEQYYKGELWPGLLLYPPDAPKPSLPEKLAGLSVDRRNVRWVLL